MECSRISIASTPYRTMNERCHINSVPWMSAVCRFHQVKSISFSLTRRFFGPTAYIHGTENRTLCQAHIYLAKSHPYMSIMIFYISGSRDSARRTRNRRESKDGSTSLTCTSEVHIASRDTVLRREIIVRGQSYFYRLPKYWPPIPLSAWRVCPPPNKGGGYTLAGRRGGWGVNILEDDRNRIALLQWSLYAVLYVHCTENGFWACMGIVNYKK